MRQLSGLDASFLYLETAEMPMHVGALHQFELPASYRGNFLHDMRAHMATRIPLAPALRRNLQGEFPACLNDAPMLVPRPGKKPPPRPHEASAWPDIASVTQALDARQYQIVPVAAPTDEERHRSWIAFQHALWHILPYTLLQAAHSIWSFFFNNKPVSANLVTLAIAGVCSVLSAIVFGMYLRRSLNRHGRHVNDAFAALRIEGYKSFLRIVVKPEQLVVYAVGLDAVPTEWMVKDRFIAGQPCAEQERCHPGGAADMMPNHADHSTSGWVVADVGRVQRRRTPSAPTTTSPSSLANPPRCGSGRMSSTTSEGRLRRTPSGVTTIGRLIRIGCASIWSISCSSVHFGSSSPSSS